MIRHINFILGGKAVFTVTDKLAGRHFTYRVNQMELNGVKQPQYFVSLGIGYEDSIYLGMIRMRNGNYELFLTAKSKMRDDAPSVQLFRLILEAAQMDDAENSMIDGSAAYEFKHEGKCCVCARPLTNPESIDMGIGPECRMKAAGFTHVSFQN